MLCCAMLSPRLATPRHATILYYTGNIFCFTGPLWSGWPCWLRSLMILLFSHLAYCGRDVTWFASSKWNNVLFQCIRKYLLQTGCSFVGVIICQHLDGTRKYWWEDKVIKISLSVWYSSGCQPISVINTNTMRMKQYMYGYPFAYVWFNSETILPNSSFLFDNDTYMASPQNGVCVCQLELYIRKYFIFCIKYFFRCFHFLRNII